MTAVYNDLLVSLVSCAIPSLTEDESTISTIQRTILATNLLRHCLRSYTTELGCGIEA